MIGSVRNRDPERSYWTLARRLHSTQFVYFVPNDSNRAADGISLRDDFLESTPDAPYDTYFMSEECSFLEMMLALAKRAYLMADEDVVDGGVGGWFWEMAGNLGFDRLNDSRMKNRSLEEIDRVVRRVHDRSYSRDGTGGLFPLNKRPRKDQRGSELWYQLNSYLLDRGYIDPIPDDVFP